MENSIYERILNGELSFKVEDSCPVATKDIAVNLKNRKTAIDSAMYGPLNPSEPNEDYWKKIGAEWDVDVASAKKQLCGNCVMFIVTPQMKDCINSGVTEGERPDEWAAIDSAGQLGYCEAFDFKCAAKRTCRAWVVGGPITEEKENQVEEKAAKGRQESQISSWMSSMSDDEVDSLFPEKEELTDEEVKWMFGDDAESFKQSLMERRKMRGGYASLDMEEKAAKKPVLRDPKGGLTAAGRAHFNKTEGSNLKPGVKGPADTPEKMRRKGSFLARFFSNPRGPMKDDKGRPTRLALSAAAWGESVPQTVEAAKKLADKGQNLLAKYRRYKEAGKGKKSLAQFDYEVKALGAPVAQQSGTVSSRQAAAGGSQKPKTISGRGASGDTYNPNARDMDGDGNVQEGTDFMRPADPRPTTTDRDKRSERADKRTTDRDKQSRRADKRGITRSELEAMGFDGEEFMKLMDAESRKLKPGQKTNWNPGSLPNGGKIAPNGIYISPEMVRIDAMRSRDNNSSRRRQEDIDAMRSRDSGGSGDRRRGNAPRTSSTSRRPDVQVPTTSDGTIIPNKNTDKRKPKPKGTTPLEDFI